MKPVLKTIFFDFDGVLADSVEIKSEAFALLYKNEGEQIQNLMRTYHLQNGGMPRAEKIQRFETEILKRPLTQKQLADKIESFGRIVEDLVVQSPAITGAGEFLKEHYKKYDLHVISATPQDELIRIITARKMDQYFKSVLGSPLKKPEHINAALAQTKTDNQNAVMIGDSSVDHEAALKTNLKFIGVRKPKDERLFPLEIPVLPNLTGLKQTLEQLFQT